LPGPHFQTIKTWAEQHQVAEIFEAIALTFGFTENFTVIGNLARELSNKDSVSLLAQWDANPYAFQLRELSSAYNADIDISSAFSGMPHDTSRERTKTTLRRAGADIKNEHFLLEMIVNPLAQSRTDELNRLRRALRLWLIMQAIERTVKDACFHDSQIQQVASALSLPGQNDKWGVIDALLTRAKRALTSKHYSYQQFNLALRYASTQLLTQYSAPDDRKSLLLLRSVQKVSEGQRNPIVGRRVAPAINASFTELKRSNLALVLDRTTETQQVLAYSESDSSTADPDDLEQLILFDVNPQETPEEQQLSGRSVVMQTAELSHYLPWSWDKPLPPENQLLEDWLTRNRENGEFSERLGTALVWLAINFGRSLEFVLEFQITDSMQAEWSICRDASAAHRILPKRHNSWFPRPQDEQLIEPFEECLRVTLPSWVQEILQHATQGNQDAPSLRRLWTLFGSQDINTWFNQHARQNFPRLSSAKLANAQSQKVFDAKGDHSLARLISAHPRSALPAACGYTNWDIDEVRSGFLSHRTEAAARTERINLLGSVLAPLESFLIEVIQRGTEKLFATRACDAITFHNHLVTYTVTALYAATGCRHLSEPFESLSHFCFDPPAVFINDKNDDGLHCGRMVPLAHGAVSIINSYLEHLRKLSDAVRTQHKRLAERIENVLQGRSDHLPLFFLLDHFGFWHPLNDPMVSESDFLEFGLPKNLFRHRFSQQLARYGVNPEVIDGWLGHAERGVTTYSDHSPQCWKHDADEYRQVVDDCFDRLGFSVSLPTASYERIQLHHRPDTINYEEPKYFGQEKRHRERLRARNEARSTARKDLDFFLATNPLPDGEKLNQPYVDDAVKHMLLRENGLPHPRAAIRMEVLIQWLENADSQARRFIRHRLSRFGNERSLFRSSCAQALRVMPELKLWASQIKQDIRQKRYSKSDELALAMALLAIEKRISYLQLLEDLVRGRNYRIIQHKQHVYLEYNEALEYDNFDQPVQRHEIDHATGRMLARGLGLKSMKDLNQTRCPKPLISLYAILRKTKPQHEADHTRVTFAHVLNLLNHAVEQANLVELPGIVAGALSERNPPTSVCLYDHLRIVEGLRYKSPASHSTENFPEPETPNIIPAMAPLGNSRAFYSESAVFLRALHDILNQYTKSKSETIARQIERHCRSNARKVSSAILMIGYWVAFRILRGKGAPNRKHKPYAASSIKRYLTALSPAFRGLASNTDLISMTEEEVTELCARMLEHQGHKQKDLHYFSARLIDFFDWATEHGVSAPDWDELDIRRSGRSVRPRLFSEEEYHRALKILLHQDPADADRGRQAAFVLLLAFRFGLRAQEALGLLRSDWCQSGQLTWVLVQNNPIRALKNAQNSRRAVPLMFELAETERMLVETILTQYTTRSGDITNKPILGANDSTLTPFAKSIPSDIAKALKLVTGNSRMSLHQARHVFCNVLTSAVFGIHTPLASHLSPSSDDEVIKTIMLGTNSGLTRRGAMAIGRVLGHQTPHTQMRSYNHLLTEWADALTPLTSRYKGTIRKAIQIHHWTIEPPPNDISPSTVFSEQTRLSPKNVVESLRLMALGYVTNRIEHCLRLETGELADVETFVDRINASIRFKVFDPQKGKKTYLYGRSLPKYLLKSRPPGVWPRLLELTERLPSRDQLSDSGFLPSLDQASNLIGRNGHLLTNLPEESRLLRLVVDCFGLPETSYVALIKSRPEESQRADNLLLDGGFSRANDVTISLDTFNEDYGRPFGRARSYAGLVLRKPAVGPLHDGLELVLAYISVAAAYCPRTRPLSPQPTTRPIHSR
jgi:integrase